MTKFQKVFARLFWSESQNDVVLAADNDATFNINLGKLLVGTLLYSDGMWHFSYSDEFKIQNRVLPWQTFLQRIKSILPVSCGHSLHRAYQVMLSFK